MFSLATIAYCLGSFLGIIILGLVAGIMSIRMELEKDGTTSGAGTPDLYASQMKSREFEQRSDRAARLLESHTMVATVRVVQVVSLALVLGGVFGLLFGK